MIKQVTFSLLMFLNIWSVHSYADAPSSLISVLSNTTAPSAETAEEPAFLKVDQAFQFTSETVDDGIILKWKIAEHYYLYKGRTKFKAVHANAILGAPRFSTEGEPKEDPYFGQVHTIHDSLEVFLPVKLAKGANEAEIKVSYQGCAEAGLCYPPKHQYILFLAEQNTAVPGQKATGSSTPTNIDTQNTTLNLDEASGVFNFIENSSLPLIIGIFFLLGVGLTFTPCVFPMVPIITSIIAGQEKPTMGKSLALSSAYVVGMAATYASAGVVTGLLGAGANVQAALQNPFLLSFFAIIFLLLACAMFGLYELQLPAFIRDRLNNTSQKISGGHITGVFFIGSLSALIVSPCVSAPLAGALLYISSTADAVVGGASLFALGLGMGVPLIIIAVGGGKFFPKAGMWMDTVKHVFGVMLVAVAIWLISRVIPAEVSLGLWAILLGLVATQMGAFDPAKPGWARIHKGAGIILAIYAVILIIGAFTGAQSPLKPLENLTSNARLSATTAVTEKIEFNIIYDISGLDSQLANADNKPVLVDFYADWCISCKVMENQVFPHKDIASKLEQFHLVKADVTENSQENQDLLNEFGLFGPPSILLFDRNGKEIQSLRIVGEIGKEGFEKRLALALKE
jgi:thiol:disulfide interchange protein DsbD